MTDIPIRKFPLESFFTIGKLPAHDLLKEQLLDIVSNAEADNINNHDSYYADQISRFDWSQSKNFDRPWVQLVKPHLDDYLNKLASALGYKNSIIEDIWFQQYNSGDSHGWHTHASNFTGVYYLELDKDGPKTEIIEPSRQSKKFVADVKEGDILMCPSYVLHRSPSSLSNSRKTIIGINFLLDSIDADLLKMVNQL
jgi:hypothetical protein